MKLPRLPKINTIILTLIFSDVFAVTGIGLIEPIQAIYIHDELKGGSILSAGFASFLFLFVKSAIQLPIAVYVDKRNHRTSLLLLGTACIAITPFIYAFAPRIEWVYLAQILYGIAGGLVYPAWLGLWSTHLDRHKESFEWTLYSTLTGFATAFAAAAGAVIASWIGFRPTYFIVGLTSIASCLALLPMALHIDRLCHKHKTNEK